MIRGTVSKTRDATVLVDIEDPDGSLHPIEAIVDTGFDGFLTLPLKLLEAFSATWSGQAAVALADGSEIECDLYELPVVLDGKRRLVDIDAAETMPLLGMSLLDGFILRIDAVVGGEVSISAR